MPDFDLQPGHVDAFDLQAGHVGVPAQNAAPAVSPAAQLTGAMDRYVPKPNGGSWGDNDAVENSVNMVTGMGMPIPEKIPGLFSWLGSKLGPKMGALEDRLAGTVAAKIAKPAMDTAKSAKGTLGAATAEGSRTIERLGMEGGLSPAERDLNRVALSTPEAGALASDLAAKARTKLPGQLASIESARTLADTTAQDAESAYANGKTPQAAWDSLKRRAAGQVRRYAVPTIAGAVGGALLDDDNHGAGALSGAALGLATSRQTRAVTDMLTSPEAKRLAAGGLRTLADKMVGLSKASPEIMGKFGPPLLSAAQRGPDALAAAHYSLQQDPDYQARMQIASKGEDAK